MNQNNSHEYMVLQSKVPLLLERLSKINERLAQAAAPLITFKVEGNPEFRRVRTSNGLENLLMVNVKLARDIETPAGNIELVAATKIDLVTEYMEHKTFSALTSEEEDKIKNPVSACFCDHCQRNQKRVNIYSLRTDVGVVRVGSGCIDNFTGFSNMRMSKWVDAFNKATQLAEEATLINFAETREQSALPVELFLCETIEIIKKDGYRTLYADGHSTANEAFISLLDKFDAIENGELSYPVGTTKKAQDVIDYLVSTGMDDEKRSNDYFSNLRALIDVGYLTTRQTGKLASAVKVYDEQLALRKAKEADKASNYARQFYGEVGSRVPLKNLVIESVYHDVTNIAGRPQTTVTKLRMHDEQGHLFSWNQSGYFEYELGSKVHLVGTIVKHDNWHYRKLDREMFDNKLSRCKIMPEIEIDALIEKGSKKRKPKVKAELSSGP